MQPIGGREWLVAGSAGATLAFSAFGLGGIPTWTLHTLFAGGVLTFLLSVVPLPRIKSQRAEGRGHEIKVRGQSSSAANAKRLLRWPPFYLSLAFLIYLLMGALNPAVEVVRNESAWWVQEIQSRWPIWLPISVRSEYDPMNAWRVLASFTGSFALMWGLWAGLTRRKAVLLVLWSLLISGAAMAFVGILQHLTEAEAVLWTFPSSNRNFWGSFFYRNQGAAYLNLILVTAGVLYFYHAQKSRGRGQSGGPHLLCFVLFAGVVASVGLALSRGGILFAGILTVCFLALVLIHTLIGIRQITSFWAALVPLVLLTLGVLVVVRYVDLEAIEQRFGDIEETIEEADQDLRYYSTKATWDMAQDRLWAGWGAGSFRYIFPIYQKEYPKIFYNRYREDRGWVGRKVYRYAHNDIVQFIAEYGLIGSGLLVLTFGSIIFPLILPPKNVTYATLFLLAGITCACLHATVDFIFNSPAYWLALVGLIVGMSKLLKKKSSTRRGHSHLDSHSAAG
ncbi:O-antigen ligase family protein [bacterium]|nr:O-antigen ligase family protein [bacterium]